MNIEDIKYGAIVDVDDEPFMIIGVILHPTNGIELYVQDVGDPSIKKYVNAIRHNIFTVDD